MSYDITITIDNVETADFDDLKRLCGEIVEFCNAMCRNCDFTTVKRFSPADYEMEEVKDE